MDAVVGLSGVFLLVVSVICLIVFGIILIVRAAKKRPKKAMAIATLASGSALIIGFLLLIAGGSMVLFEMGRFI